MACCRHDIVLAACNIYQGETYRHIHYIHNILHRQFHCTFLCYDVICQYWKWACKVGQIFKEYESMTSEMKAFLSRMHAVAHVWWCYVIVRPYQTNKKCFVLTLSVVYRSYGLATGRPEELLPLVRSKNRSIP